MPAIPTSLNFEFFVQLNSMIQNFLDEVATAKARMIWEIVQTTLAQHWLLIIIGLPIVLFVSFVLALIGYWWILGSILYHLFYFGFLYPFGLIFGPEIYVKNIFVLFCEFILYPVCFIVTGMILDMLGVKRLRFRNFR
jgi:hypothetical protein